jgi:hypothetical protein
VIKHAMTGLHVSKITILVLPATVTFMSAVRFPAVKMSPATPMAPVMNRG